jgi:hypothetical protein
MLDPLAALDEDTTLDEDTREVVRVIYRAGYVLGRKIVEWQGGMNLPFRRTNGKTENVTAVD